MDSPTLPMSSRLGLFPYAKLIYKHSDKQTKLNLRMTCRSLWKYHCNRKYKNNYVEEQSGHLKQLYCYKEECPNRVLFEDCFRPRIYTTDIGEVCGHLSPRNRQGWPIIGDDNSWGRQPPKKVKNWQGCPECWKDFIRERPEYDLSLRPVQNDFNRLFKRLCELKQSQKENFLQIGLDSLAKSIIKDIRNLLKSNPTLDMSMIDSTTLKCSESIFHMISNEDDDSDEVSDQDSYEISSSSHSEDESDQNSSSSDSNMSGYSSSDSSSDSMSSDLMMSESESD